MKIYRNIFAGFAVLLFASICFGQTSQREKALQEIEDLRQQIQEREKVLL